MIEQSEYGKAGYDRNSGKNKSLFRVEAASHTKD